MATLTLGNLSAPLTPLRDDPEQTRLPEEIRRTMHVSPREIYRWTCPKGPGSPTPRPSEFTMDADIIYVPWFFPAIGNPPAGFGPEEVGKRLLETVGVATAADLQKLLDQAFGRGKVPIPYDQLIDPFQKSQSRALFVQEDYMRFAFPLLQRPGDSVAKPVLYLMIPLGGSFLPRVLSTCEGDLAENFGWKGGASFRARLSPLAEEMLAAYSARAVRWW